MKCDAQKKFTIAVLPTVLCLHVKRFRWRTVLRNKIDTHVVFPVMLDMSEFTVDKQHSAVYKLTAVINHHGSSSMSGHYTAFCRSRFDDQWRLFNDAKVSVISEDQVTASQAYILVYQRLPSVLDTPARPLPPLASRDTDTVPSRRKRKLL